MKAVDLADKDIGDIFGIVYHVVGDIVMHLR